MKLKMMGLGLGLLAAACGSSSSTGGDQGVINDIVGGDGDSGAPSANSDSGTSGGECSDTYDNFGRGFMDKYCASCHAASVTGAARNAAPPEEVFDTLDQIKGNVDEILTDVTKTKTMPFPTSKVQPTDAERERFAAWLNCGPN